MEKKKENFRDVLEIEGIRARGYGILPKMIMLDRKLSIEAKGIYAYFCSYAGSGTTAFPSVNKITADLGISKKRYYSHFSQLKNLGYITVVQIKTAGNKFSHNIYTLVENPVEKPCSQNDATEEKPCSRFTYTQNATTQNDTTNNNKSFINNNNVLYNQSINQENDEIDSVKNKNSNKESLNKEKNERNKDLVENVKSIKEIIKTNIEYPVLVKQYKDSILDDIVNIMTDTIEDNKEYITFSKNEKIPTSKIKTRLLSLNSMDIQYVVECFENIDTEIRNPRNYILKMLYNAKNTSNIYYKNMVNYTTASI